MLAIVAELLRFIAFIADIRYADALRIITAAAFAAAPEIILSRHRCRFTPLRLRRCDTGDATLSGYAEMSLRHCQAMPRRFSLRHARIWMMVATPTYATPYDASSCRCRHANTLRCHTTLMLSMPRHYGHFSMIRHDAFRHAADMPLMLPRYMVTMMPPAYCCCAYERY